MKLRSLPGSPSPLGALAWGFLALTPMPLCALFFAGESALARKSEIALASVFFLFAVIFFVAAYWDSNREPGRGDDAGDRSEDGPGGEA